jgi:hypothetical protein
MLPPMQPPPEPYAEWTRRLRPAGFKLSIRGTEPANFGRSKLRPWETPVGNFHTMDRKLPGQCEGLPSPLTMSEPSEAYALSAPRTCIGPAGLLPPPFPRRVNSLRHLPPRSSAGRFNERRARMMTTGLLSTRPRLAGDAVAVAIVLRIVARLAPVGGRQANGARRSAVRRRCRMPQGHCQRPA